MNSIVKEEDEDVFFDTVESNNDMNDDSLFYKSVYEVWTSEPQSVQERRHMFLHDMCMDETSLCTCANVKCSEDDMDESSSDTLDDDAFSHENSLHGREDEETVLSGTSSSDRVFDHLSHMLECEWKELTMNSHFKEMGILVDKKKRMRNWIELMLEKTAKKGSKPKLSRMKVNAENKKSIEFSAVYVGQKIKAHSGCIEVMKFSPDGHYLASGGKDGVIRIWLITSIDGDDMRLRDLQDEKKSSSAYVVIPDKLFHINEYPLHEFFGHSGRIADLSWSRSNHLVSSSKDGTVRLWQIGTDNCLNVFQHSDSVTCVQFNPVNDDYFISGCIDGKNRIWGTCKGRVTDWIDIRDVITAICYQPDGTGFIVGSSTGKCRFFRHSGDDPHPQLEAEVQFQRKKKPLRNKITSSQFSPDEIQRIMITSGDSVIRILDGVSIVHKYKGIRKSSRQLSASFTTTGQHIISLDTDSRIYVWNFAGTSSASEKKSSTTSCEHFIFKDVSVAIPWSPPHTKQTSLPSSKSAHMLNSKLFSQGASTTWPEDLLPSAEPVSKIQFFDKYRSFPINGHIQSASSDAWGLVIVTASRDGVIRTFHNYGLPTRSSSRLCRPMAQ